MTPAHSARTSYSRVAYLHLDVQAPVLA
jgi:hypothetical protein